VQAGEQVTQDGEQSARRIKGCWNLKNRRRIIKERKEGERRGMEEVKVQKKVECRDHE
jgi:hypothetical protein